MIKKRGLLVFDVMMFMIRLFFMIIVVFSVVMLIKSQINSEIDTFEAQADIFLQRLLFSEVSYKDDDISRSYPGIVDLEMFRSGDIESAWNKSIYYGIENKFIGAEMVLRNKAGTIHESIKFNPEFYDNKLTLIKAELISGSLIRGPGMVRSKTRMTQVLIKDNNNLVPGSIETTIIIQNI